MIAAFTDAGKRVGMLLRSHAGDRKVWSVVRVPTPEEEDRRTFIAS